MKKIYLLPFLLSMAFGGSEFGVEDIVKKLEKVGAWKLPETPDYVIYDPFRKAEPLIREAKRKVSVRGMALPRVSAVMNERAFVDGRWVARGDRVGSYKVVAVRPDGIVMKKGGKTVFIPLRHEKKVLKIKETKR